MTVAAVAPVAEGPLRGRVAIVTGAGRGLGGAIALALAREGATLALCDIDEAALADTRHAVEAAGARCLAMRCDVSDRSAVDGFVDRVATNLGGVHVLVNNAARVPSSAADTERRNRHYAHVTTPQPRDALGVVASLSDDDWLRWWDVNVHGAFWCTRAALRHMVTQRQGRIVNIASIAGLGAISMHSPGYSASKAALIGLTQTTAYDVAGANVFVNAIACGGVLTPPMQAFLDGATPAQRAALMQLIPAGRLGSPAEYASLAVYLAGDTHYLTGQVISPNGGAVI